MSADYVLPGSVLLLKLMFRLLVDQKPSVIDSIKAVIAFPVDMTFLLFSFGAATLAHDQYIQKNPDIRMIVSLVILGVVCAFVTTKLSRISDEQFDKNHYGWAGISGGCGYLVAVAVIYCSFRIGAGA
jgi:hypothetical protein